MVKTNKEYNLLWKLILEKYIIFLQKVLSTVLDTDIWMIIY